MYKNPRSLTSFLALAALSGMCFAENVVETAAAEAVGAADPVTTGDAAPATPKRAPAANFLPIVRGRLPMLLVHAVRFDEVLGKIGNKDLAAKMATSVGKVFDIRKGRNFAYLTKGWKPTALDVTEARNWAAQIGQSNAKGLTAAGDAKMINELVAQYEKVGLASAEQAAAFAAAKPKSNFGNGEASTQTASNAGAANALSAGAEGGKKVKGGAKAGNADDLLA